MSPSNPSDLAELAAELQQTSAALRESTLRFAALEEALGTGIMVLDSVRDRDGGIIDFTWQHVNRAAERIIRRSASTLLGRRLLEEMPGNRTTGLFDAYVRVVESGEPWTGEFEYRQDGLDHAFNTVAARCGDGFLVSFRDVTGQERLEQEARRERERMYELFRHAPAFMGAVSGPDHVIDMVNDAYCELLGPRPLLGRAVAEALPEAVEQGFVKLLDGVRASRTAFVGRNIRFERRPPGGEAEARLVDFVYQPVLDAAGDCSGIFIHGVDVTDRVTGAEALQRSEQRFRSMMEHAADVVCAIGADGLLRYTSPSFDRGLGYDSAELIGQGALELVHPDDLGRAQEALMLVGAGKVPLLQLEARVRNAQGRYRTLDVVVQSLLDDPAVQAILVTGRDVTDQRALEEQLRQAQKMEAVGKLAGGVAHDFNNLLTVIDAHSSFLLESSEPGEQRHDDATEIRKAAQRAARLTRQLLAFSRKQMLTPRVIDLNATIEELGGMLHRLIGEDIEVRLELEPGLGSVLADPGQIEQVLVNLVINARDAMPTGGTLTVRTQNRSVRGTHGEVAELTAGRWVMLEVRDSGHGIAPEVLDHIFDPFFTTKPQGMGTGLGLSTVYGIVRQSSGAVWCRSAPGRGATFTVALPRVDSASVPQGDAGTPAMNGWETVLLVEDEAAVRSLAKRVLSRQGYQVLEAGDGEEALRVAEAHTGTIDLVVTDSVMPRMGGAEMAGALLQRRPATRVLFMSGYTDDEIVRRGIASDPGAFLQKPFTAQDLARRVREVLDERTHKGAA